MADGSSLLTINAGSSSLKFAVFRSGTTLERTASGTIDRIGQPPTRFHATDVRIGAREERDIAAADAAACIEPVLGWLERHGIAADLAAVGHRVVHGGPRYFEPQRVDPEVLSELRRLAPFDPEHLPAAIGWIDALARRWPQRPQIACFDTAFHRDLPRPARLLPIPLHYAAAGVVRYGFHGLSYEYLVDELQRIAGPTAAEGRLILAHLGSGASMAAVVAGQSLDTTMAFTPAAGLPMSRRSGDLDPGLADYFARTEGMSPSAFQSMVHSQSGLLGLSETSSDMRDLLERASTDVRARDAIAVFCYEAKKRVGAYAAVLGGLDTVVFSGGIGTHSAAVRSRICDGLEFLGIDLDPARNDAGAAVVSTPTSPVTIRVLPTDEELQIARHVQRRLDRGI